MKNTKDDLIRFGVSIEQSKLDILDKFMVERKIKNRSQAIRQLISNIKLDHQLENNSIVGGSIMLSYDHHKREILDTLNNIQHKYHSLIFCSQHIHLNHEYCMEIIALKGKPSELRELADELLAVKGIMHGELSMTIIE